MFFLCCQGWGSVAALASRRKVLPKLKQKLPLDSTACFFYACE